MARVRHRPSPFTKAMLMLGLCAQTIPADPALARPLTPRPDTVAARAEVESLIQSLHARLLASQTATAALEAWCADQKLAIVPAIKARIVASDAMPPTKEQRERLRIGAAEPVKYRRVALVCGDVVLSEAENWYVPGRLTKDMNTIVDTTDTPFGRAVAALRPHRKTFAVTRLWDPVRRDSSASREVPGKTLEIPWLLLEHRALVFTGDDVPFAEVRETYTRDILGFAAP